jgi:hypothetical protein
VSILKQQAALLGEKTRQLVKDEVVTQATGNLFVHYFYIAAPTLSYKFELFTLSHGVNFYPLVMKSLNNTIPLNSESEFKDKHKRNLRRAAHPQRRALYPRPGPLLSGGVDSCGPTRPGGWLGQVLAIGKIRKVPHPSFFCLGGAFRFGSRVPFKASYLPPTSSISSVFA